MSAYREAKAACDEAHYAWRHADLKLVQLCPTLMVETMRGIVPVRLTYADGQVLQIALVGGTRVDLHPTGSGGWSAAGFFVSGSNAATAITALRALEAS